MVCPLCQKTDFNILFRDHNRRDNIKYTGLYVQCVGCSLVYLCECPPWEDIVRFYPSLDEDYATNSGIVDAEAARQQMYKPVSGWKGLLRKVRFRPHSWPLAAVPKGSKRIIDLGCGSGTKLFEFYKRGYDVWGVDVAEDAIRRCKELLPEGHFVQGELHEINLPEGHFDYIRIDNALEHVPNPKEIVRECRRLLCDGGQLMVYVPHGRSLSMRLMKGNSISSWIPFHLQLFTRKSLRRLISESGFTDIRIYNHNPTSWLPLSYVQWRRKKKPALKMCSSTLLALVCYPIGYLAVKLGIGEELVGICVKNDKN